MPKFIGKKKSKKGIKLEVDENVHPNASNMMDDNLQSPGSPMPLMKSIEKKNSIPQSLSSLIQASLEEELEKVESSIYPETPIVVANDFLAFF